MPVAKANALNKNNPLVKKYYILWESKRDLGFLIILSRSSCLRKSFPSSNMKMKMHSIRRISLNIGIPRATVR